MEDWARRQLSELRPGVVIVSFEATGAGGGRYLTSRLAFSANLETS